MPERVQPIYSDSPGAIANAVYELPAGLDLELFSVRARVSGAAAAASFIVVCEVLTQDGRIMAQSEIEQTLAVGDTGALTWAPFLRSQAAATPASSFTSQFISMQNNNVVQSILSSTSWTRCDLSAGTAVASDTSRIRVDTVNADFAEIRLTGLYVVRAVAVWNATFAATCGIMLYDTLSRWGVVSIVNDPTAATNFGAGLTVEEVRRFPGGGTSIAAYVFQTSGVNRVLADMLLEVDWLGDYQGQPANYSPF